MGSNLPRESATMKVIIDKEADVLYMRISDTRIHDSEEIKPGIILDYDDQNNLVGIEILRVSERVPSASLKTVMIESAWSLPTINALNVCHVYLNGQISFKYALCILTHICAKWVNNSLLKDVFLF